MGRRSLYRSVGLTTACVVGLGVLASCTPANRHLVVFQTTDVHGYFSAQATDQGGTVGGMRRLSALVEAERSQGRAVLLIDSGDMWSGTLISDRNEGALGVAVYDAVGYDAAALGNHELDFGPIGPARTGSEAPFGALEARLAEAGFPILAANVIDRATGRIPDWPGFAASTVVERGGFRIGLVGVATEDTPTITFPHVGALLEFTDATQAAAREAARLRRDEDVDLVFVLAHIGGRCDRFDRPDDTSSCLQDSPLFRLVRGLPPGAVDAVFGGHTHRQVAHRVAGTVVVQSGRYLRAAGRLDVRSDKGAPPVLSPSPPIDLIGPEDGPRRAALDAALAPAEAEVATLRAERLGARVVEPITRDRRQQSPLGALVCDVLLHRYTDHTICLINSGGLRNDLPSGELTYGDLYDAMPFGNAAATLEIPGSVLREIIRSGTSGAHGVLQVAGLRVSYDLSRDACPTVDRDGNGTIGAADRDRLVTLTLADGTPVDPSATYRVITNSFLALGGDDWRPLLSRVHPARIKVRSDELPVRETLGAWMREARPILNSLDRPLLTQPRVTAYGEAPDGSCAREGAHSH